MVITVTGYKEGDRFAGAARLIGKFGSCDVVEPVPGRPGTPAVAVVTMGGKIQKTFATWADFAVFIKETGGVKFRRYEIPNVEAKLGRRLTPAEIY